MAFNLNSGVGGRRSRGLPAMAEINVTPFVDVALVLLIIFMITAHVMEYGIEVDVPKTRTVASSIQEHPIVVITPKGDLYLGSKPVNIATLVSEVHARYPGEAAVYLRADRITMWEPIVQVLNALHDGKIAVNAVTELDDTATKNRR